MVKLLPQEIEVWYLLPALRRELTLELLNDKSIKQKEVAKILGVTEAAISQYKKQKRASELQFSDSEQEIIRDYAKKMKNSPAKFSYYLYQLSKKLIGCSSMCSYHKKIDSSVPQDCRLCKLH